jgi:hypothetical protein
MKLLLEPRGRTSAAPLPEGVRVLERLASGTVVVDATPLAKRVLQQSPLWAVVEDGYVTVDPGGVDEGRFVDVFAASAAARARRAKLKAG